MKHRSRQPVFTEEKLAPTEQYTSATTISNAVYVRGRSAEGAPIFSEVKYKPEYYLPTRDGMTQTHIGYDGTLLTAVSFKNIKRGREWLKLNSGAWGNIQTEYRMLHDIYGTGDVPFDMERLYRWNIDIEVDRDPERGFAPVDDPFNPVIAITVIWRHMGEKGRVVYGTGDYVPTGDELYIKCADEKDLLLHFLNDYKANGDYPDILTGWNIQFYDIPYLVNRLKLLFEEDVWSSVSPFGRLAERNVILNHKSQLVVDVKGIVILDYLEMYRKFTYTQQESYRLDHIAHVELKKRKVSYADFRSLDRVYRENHQLFIEYNLQDVQLVDELDQKLKLMALVCALAYMAKSNMADTFKQVRLWDIMIFHRLRGQDQQIPPRIIQEKNDQYEGAYVKKPLAGLHEWIVSFDVASMYPHIIRQWNLSPETLIDKIDMPSVDSLMVNPIDTSQWKQLDQCVAINGVLTRRDKEGFIPNMLKVLYEERKKFQKLEQAAEQQIEELKLQESSPELDAKIKVLREQKSAYGNQQLVRKVNLNSAYGALGSQYFRYFDIRLAEAVTVTGQLVIRRVAQNLNAYLNKTFKTDDVDYILAIDTDSNYVRLNGLVEQYRAVKPDATTLQTVAMLDKYANERLQPVINDTFADIAEWLNVYTPCMSMAREVIADKCLFTGVKKRYVLNVWDKSGIKFFDEETGQRKSKLTMKGIEAVKSSTPAIVRGYMNKSLQLLMTGTKEDLWNYIASCKREFHKAPFEDVAFPRSVNGIKKYATATKHIPINVRGALTFNRYLAFVGQEHTIQPIHDGEKIKYGFLKEPNPFGSNVMCAPAGCPADWMVESWFDYNTQWNKSFIEPLNSILSIAGWTTEPVYTLF